MWIAQVSPFPLVYAYIQQVDRALPGSLVAFGLNGVTPTDVKRGMVVGDWQEDPPRGVRMFVAQIKILNHPTEIKLGYKPVVHVHTAAVACKVRLSFVY